MMLRPLSRRSYPVTHLCHAPGGVPEDLPDHALELVGAPVGRLLITTWAHEALGCGAVAAPCVGIVPLMVVVGAISAFAAFRVRLG